MVWFGNGSAHHVPLSQAHADRARHVEEREELLQVLGAYVGVSYEAPRDWIESYRPVTPEAARP